MKKAVVKIGGKQYVVAEKETLRVDLLPEGTKDLALDALLVIDGDKTTVGDPIVKGVKVKAKVVEAKVAGDKIRVIRYHSKKRVHTEIGHRQKYSEIEIVKKAKKENPVLLLDDVLSELDSNRQNYLLNTIGDIQTIITCTGLDEFVNNRFEIDKLFKVTEGTVYSEN